jgi:site-specific recombinase XerD
MSIASTTNTSPTLPAKTRKTSQAEVHLPAIIMEACADATERFLEFFTANIRNINTRRAYVHAVKLFLQWCEEHSAGLKDIRPIVVAAYIEQLTNERAPQTVKQHLAAIRMLFDWLVTGQVVPMNPAASVRGPRYSIKEGKTPVLKKEDARKLLDSIDITHVVGLRDRALIGLMVYSFARVGAVVKMKVSDYYQNGKRFQIRLHEKGGKFHKVPVHHTAEEYLDAYVDAASLAEDKKGFLFRSTRGRSRKLSERPMDTNDVLRMVKRYAKKAGLSPEVCCHTFRATGITNYMLNGGTIERAAKIANHESTRTTGLYNRQHDAISLDEIERILI